MRPRILLPMLLAVAVATTSPARAATGKGDLPVYVSARFKKVAKRAFRQIVTLRLEKACGGHPLCKPLVDTVTQAFAAALTGNATELRASLSGLFADSAVNGLLSLTLDELLASRMSREERNITRALVTCLARAVTDKRPDKACLADAIKPLRSGTVDLGHYRGAAAAVDRLVGPLDAHRAPSPYEVLAVLDGMAKHLNRTDVATYLAGIRVVVAKGLDAGLFPALYGALRDDGLVGVKKTLMGEDAHVVLAYTEQQDADYLAAIARAKERDAGHSKDYDAWTAAYQTWRSVRSTLRQGVRREVLLREPINISALGDVLRAARKNQLPASLPKADRDALDTFSWFGGFLFGTVRMQNFINRYSVALLAAGAVVDYARTGDDAVLLVDAKMTVLFAAGLMALRARAEIDLAPPNDPAKAPYRPLTEADQICEVQELAALLGLAKPSGAPASSCYSVLEKKDRPIKETPSVADARRAALDEIAKLLAGKVNLPLEDLRRVLASLERGDGRAAARGIARIGITAIMDRLDDVLTEVLSVDADECARDAGWATIAKSTDARCAVYALVTAAYDPVADYLWDVGAGANAPDVAEKVYRSFLDSRLLDSVPLVVNVGLGANQIWLQGSREDFAAVTLVDKFGVAVIKDFDRHKVFELGLFVGGFLDALVRTAAEEGQDKRYWLGGANIGWTRINGADIGVEGHIAAAMPFEFDKDEIGLALGIAVVVPLDVVFSDEED